ncbi:MAG: hypothetical protein LBK42_05570 [Propionibacteriaceae bacterium]|jgi:ATP-dependent Clp protease ATP-binding subunit ClpA|nr:hypothetical protein [Propionibacteriaceae bacterium]
MIFRLTAEARGMAGRAYELAVRQKARSVEEGHLLIALIEHDGSAARALRDEGVDLERLIEGALAALADSTLDGEALACVGIDLGALKRRLDASFSAGALDRAVRARRVLRYSPQARQALEVAHRQATNLGTSKITEQLLLASLLRPGRVSSVLVADQGIDPEAVRARVLAPG